jgi:hypothetical protein
MSETGERDWAEWLTEGTWDVPALETREEFKAAAATALREYGDQRERAAVLTAAKAVCGSCAFEEPVTVAGIPGFWHSRVMCAASHIYDAFPNLDSREVKREG